ncbi:MAG: hypothetical protein M0P97_03195 [Candidatus Moranbacteria bacterium]|jgi:hypothetical protein|nr:hypothetical protein [Candidatus Moranbacteria bacterium]
MLSAREKNEEDMIKKVLDGEGQEDIDPKTALLLMVVILLVAISALVAVFMLYVLKG